MFQVASLIRKYLVSFYEHISNSLKGVTYGETALCSILQWVKPITCIIPSSSLGDVEHVNSLVIGVSACIAIGRCAKGAARKTKGSTSKAINGGESEAAGEAAIANVGDAVRDSNGGESEAAGEAAIAKRGGAVRDSNGGESVAIGEAAIAKGCDAVRDSDRGESDASVEACTAKGGDTVRDDYGGHSSIMPKRIVG